MRGPEEPLAREREAGWALQLCPKSERLPQRWKPDSLQWLLIIQSQFVPSRRARSPAKPPLLAARSRQSLPGLLQRWIAGFGSWARLSCPIPERSQILGSSGPRARGWHPSPGDRCFVFLAGCNQSWILLCHGDWKTTPVEPTQPRDSRWGGCTENLLFLTSSSHPFPASRQPGFSRKSLFSPSSSHPSPGQGASPRLS